MLKLRERANTWPGFVDLFSNLVIILIFLLIVFVFLWTTTSVFNGIGGGKKIAALTKNNTEQAEKLEQMTADEAEARDLLIRARSALEDLESNKVKLESDKANLESDVAALETQNSELDKQLSTTNEALTDLIADYESKLADMQKSSTVMEETAKNLETQLRTAEQKGDLAASELELQKQALLSEVARMNDLLGQAEQKSTEQETQYIELSNRLNKALADKVAELNEMAALNQYQSQFYKEIKMALTGMRGVDVSGDRFVVSSDILFPIGSYALSREGKNQLRLIANIMTELENKIPAEVDWIIRVDGHTDTKPVIPGTRKYKNNTELSFLRAQAIVNELTRAGVAKRRLVPTGFGEFYPAAPGKDEASLQKNRRIELRLTNP